MESLNRKGHLVNPQLIADLVAKLPLFAMVQWARDRRQFKEEITLKHFSEWIQGFSRDMIEVESLNGGGNGGENQESMKDNKNSNNSNYDKNAKNNKYKKSQNYYKENNKNSSEEAVMAVSERKKECTFCGKPNHSIEECRKFQREQVQARWDWATEKRVCFGCLQEGHVLPKCPTKKTCEIEKCRSSHHPLLHKERSKKEEPTVVPETVGHTVQQQLESRVLLKVVPVSVRGPRGTVKTHALLDEGSTVTLVDDKLAEEIGATGPSVPLNLKWIESETRSQEKSNIISFQITGENQQSHQIQSARTIPNFDLPVQHVNEEKLKQRWSHLKKINLSSFSNVKPRILIGQDNWDLICTLGIIRGPKNSPALSKTKLGWVLHGNVAAGFTGLEQHTSLFVSETDQLHQLVKQTMTTESFGVKIVEKPPVSRDNERAAEIMRKTMRRIENRWEVGHLWRKDDMKLPESKSTALRRLKTVENKMDRDELYAEKYSNQINDLLIKGFARKLSAEEAAKYNPHAWYLPHFGVTNPNKPGKLRVVFDAAASSHGVSLNGALLKGIDYLISLVGVLFKFREKRVAVVGDIQEMFPQIKIAPADQVAQRFLWRGKDRDRPPDAYQMTSMIFGALSSPSQAQQVKNQNALEFVEEFPEAVDVIVRKHYMDDCMASFHLEAKASQIVKDVINIHHRGGFVIRNWISNSTEVLSTIPAKLRANGDKEIEPESELPIERVLGQYWSPTPDIFKFNLKFHRVPVEVVNGNRRPTKREVLKLVMSVFDPLGFLGHFMIKAKILLQDVWRSGINWDDEITATVQEKWRIFLQELKRVETFHIPRCYSLKMQDVTSVQLHVFCDASEMAFAAVGYFRIEIGRREVTTAFVMAKTRVAPLRPLSIPRLELQAAVLGTRLAALIKEEHDLKVDSTYFWSDSKTVLLWLRSDARNYKTFVAHRVGEILETTDSSSWKWIPTLENVADEATRDNFEIEFSSSCRWLNGPSFLRLSPSEWPVENSKVVENQDVDVEKLEIKSNLVGAVNLNEEYNFHLQLMDNLDKGLDFTGVVSTGQVHSLTILPDPSRFSNWSRLVRATAWMLRFVDQCRHKFRSGDSSLPSELSANEVEKAEILWWKKVQSESFPEEVNDLMRGKTVAKSSRLFTLSCFLDKDGVIRVRGRTNLSKELDYSTKNPVVLNPKHRFTRLLVHHYHRLANHNGQEQVANEIRQKYWILDLRAAVRSSWSNCLQCRIRGARPESPQMAPLPDFRLNRPSRPFSWVGMDYFGPIQIKVGRKLEKRYGVIFTCLSTRAVHLDIASSLSTDSAIMAIRRFAARRGCPAHLYSDNGTNFKGAHRELKEALVRFDHGLIIGELERLGAKFGRMSPQWHFTAPSAPHFGGSWERLIRSVKVALESTLKERHPTEEVLRTLLAEAEHAVNSRPLTHVSVDPSDPEALTPNHFLLGSSSGGVTVPGIFTDSDLNTRKDWRNAQRLADLFWQRWTREYLPTLTRRTKWHQLTRPPKVGDLVFIVDGNLPRNCWPRGIITKLHPGRDGIVRVVDVETPYGVYRRPMVKVCVLDVQPTEVSSPLTADGGGNVAEALTREINKGQVSPKSDRGAPGLVGLDQTDSS